MKKIMQLFIIFSFLLSFITGCNKDDTTIDLNNIESSTLETTYLSKPTSGRPKNQTPINNIFIALNILKESLYYESATTGEIKAKKAITLATQKFNNRRILTPEASFSETISVSSFVKIAEQLYIEDETILKRDASSISNSTNVKWKNNTSTLTNQQFKNNYGYSFEDPSRFIINEKTISSDIQIINNGIGRKFTYKFNLDPIL